MQVTIEGNADLRKALRRFAPDLEKSLKKEIGLVLRPVVRQAKGFVPSDAPLSGWAARSFSEGRFPPFQASIIKAGIGFKSTPSKPNPRGFSSQASIFNASRAGAIYESAGRNIDKWRSQGSSPRSQSRNPNAGVQFVDALPELTGSLKGRGRLIFKAWSLNQGKAEGAVRKAISTAEQELYRRSKSANLRRVA